jgi:hypothetical protein
LGGERLFFDVGAGVAIAALAVVIIASVTRNIVTLYRTERI